MHCRSVAAMFLLMSSLVGALPAGENWPQFRGPDATGVAENNRLPDRWSATENVAWKVNVPGRGWASPIVWGDRVFLTTAVNAGATPIAKKGLYFGGEQSKPPETEHLWKVLCLDLAKGKVIWEQTAHRGLPATPLHIKNTYASETPVTDGERVYAMFGNVGIFCYTLEGKPLWSHPIKPHAMRAGWGTAASPVVHGDKLIYVNDNQEESYIAALDTRTGKELWRVAREEKSNWATPFVWKNDLRTEIVTPGTSRIRSYDLAGQVLWEMKGMSVITIATPYAVNGLLYVSSGYVLDSKRPMYAIRPGGSGDLTLTDDRTSSQFVAWSDKTAAPYNPTTLVYRDRLFVLYDMGLFACYDARTGREIYGRKRIPNGKAFTASPWGNDGNVFCLNEDGETFVIGTGDEFQILRTNPLGDAETALATPAIVGDRLLIRTAEMLYCLRRSE